MSQMTSIPRKNITSHNIQYVTAKRNRAEAALNLGMQVLLISKTPCKQFQTVDSVKQTNDYDINPTVSKADSEITHHDENTEIDTNENNIGPDNTADGSV